MQAFIGIASEAIYFVNIRNEWHKKKLSIQEFMLIKEYQK